MKKEVFEQAKDVYYEMGKKISILNNLPNIEKEVISKGNMFCQLEDHAMTITSRTALKVLKLIETDLKEELNDLQQQFEQL